MKLLGKPTEIIQYKRVVLKVEKCKCIHFKYRLANFTPSTGASSLEMEQVDNSLLAGHLNVIRGLLSCEGV